MRVSNRNIICSVMACSSFGASYTSCDFAKAFTASNSEVSERLTRDTLLTPEDIERTVRQRNRWVCVSCVNVEWEATSSTSESY